jgi:sulfate adenylyltransferase
MIAPHGGKLINKILTENQARKLMAKKLKRIKTGKDFILDLEKIAIGAYSPLKGFLKKDELASVVYKMQLPSGSPWTIPIFFSVDDATANKVSKDELIVICEENGKEIGILKAEEIFSFHKFKWAKNVFGTENKRHPGVEQLFNTHDKLIGGEVWLIDSPDFEFEKFNLTPSQTRSIIKERGWKTVAGFQTRNVPHRAHEYLQKIALTITDGILIHPIIGWKKKGDFQPELVIKAYKVLIKNYFPKNSVIFAGLATAMRYAGPREAVFHAIIRKNYGCTHFIVGRDHAGVGDFYEKYAAHRIFDRFPNLGITPLLLRGPYYCQRCKEVVSDKICPHQEKEHKHISGTIIRELILKNRKIPEYLLRQEIAEIVLEYKRQKIKEKGWCL